MALLLSIASETLRLTLQAAPFVLLGLLTAGLIHVLVPERLVLRWMGRPGLAGAARAAAIGVPLPVCSCGVVPLAVELRRKGASRPATLSFLVTTPESSLDSILLTWGLMGPVMAIARPIAAFATAMLGAVLVMTGFDEDRPRMAEAPGAPSEPGCGCGEGAEEGGDRHQHGPASDASTETARRALASCWPRLLRRGLPPDTPRPWRDLGLPALRYGFVELLDDLAFWLAAGLVLGGVLAALLPSDLAAIGLGEGILPLLLMLVVGIPLYTCASASTPVAAALVAKGLSPGAALVFLLAGPATSAATMILLAGHFGRRFVVLYVTAVAVGALLSGLALDALVDPATIRLLVVDAGTEGASGFEWIAAGALVLLLAWRFARGAWRTGWRELAGMTMLPWRGRRGR